MPWPIKIIEERMSLLRFLPVFAAWLFLFSPALLERVDAKTALLCCLAALLFWPLATRRPLMLIALAALAMLGVINIIHTSFFGYLADEFFLATSLRTTGSEVREFAGTVPAATLALVLLWLPLCAATGVFLWRTMPVLRKQGSALRWSLLAALSIWAVYLLYGVSKHYGALDFVKKMRRVYPAHMALAAVRQHEITETLFYTPRLPQALPQGPQADTIVVVLGESASAQRWSLLGYTGADTNGPLAQRANVHVARVLANGFNTAAALPFLLTGDSALESAEKHRPSFIDLARQAGYKTFVFNNSRFYSSDEDFITQTLRRSANVYKKVGDGDFDEVLTSPLQMALEDSAKRKLIVLHTYGSHPSVKHRYPVQATKFADPYDNSIRYTSELLDQWIALLDHSQASDQTALLLYTSDHGLSMPPCTNEYRHSVSRSALELPMLAWGNQALHTRMPELLPEFAAQERQEIQRSTVLLAELAMRAVGQAAVIDSQDWRSSRQLQVQSRPWSEVQQKDACSLQ